MVFGKEKLKCAFPAHHRTTGVQRGSHCYAAGERPGGSAFHPVLQSQDAVGLVHYALQPQSRLRHHTALHTGGCLPTVHNSFDILRFLPGVHDAAEAPPGEKDRLWFREIGPLQKHLRCTLLLPNPHCSTGCWGRPPLLCISIHYLGLVLDHPRGLHVSLRNTVLQEPHCQEKEAGGSVQSLATPCVWHYLYLPIGQTGARPASVGPGPWPCALLLAHSQIYRAKQDLVRGRQWALSAPPWVWMHAF